MHPNLGSPYFVSFQIEDNVPLNETFTKNPRLWCSVCSDDGHLADNCRMAPRFFGTNLPKASIASYVPLYPRRETFDAPQNPDTPSYSLVSFNRDFSFKWSSAVGQVSNGFYNRFRENVGLDQIAAEVVEIDDDDDDGAAENGGSSHDFSFTKELKKINETREFQLDLSEAVSEKKPLDPPVFENQLEELETTARAVGLTTEELKLQTARNFVHFDVASSESEYIPLNEQKGKKDDDRKCTAKILIDKATCDELLVDGGVFTNTMSKKYDLDIRMVWEQVGKMLVLHGLPDKQAAFQAELRHFMNKVNEREARRRHISSIQLPSKLGKLIKYIRLHLKMLTECKKSLPELKSVERELYEHTKAKNWKAADRCRRELNINLLGRYGLGEGKKHLVALGGQLDLLQRAKVHTRKIDFTLELQTHLSFVFSALDHENYHQLIHDLMRCNSIRQWPFPHPPTPEDLIEYSKSGDPTEDSKLFFVDLQPAVPFEVQPVTQEDRRTPDSTTVEESVVAEALPEPAPEAPQEPRRKSTEKRPSRPPSTAVEEAPPPKRRKSQQIENETTPTPPNPLTVPSGEVVAPEVSSSVVEAEAVQPPPAPPPTPTAAPAPTTDPTYSEKSRDIIREALALFTMLNNQNAVQKLNRVKQKADNNLMTQEDYNSLLQIQKIVHDKLNEIR